MHLHVLGFLTHLLILNSYNLTFVAQLNYIYVCNFKPKLQTKLEPFILEKNAFNVIPRTADIHTYKKYVKNYIFIN